MEKPGSGWFALGGILLVLAVVVSFATNESDRMSGDPMGSGLNAIRQMTIVALLVVPGIMSLIAGSVVRGRADRAQRKDDS